MPITMPADTCSLLGADAAECESRSLFMSRFAFPDAKDSGNSHPRRDWFNKLCGKPIGLVPTGGRTNWLALTTSTEKGLMLFAQLQSRLMLNMAGGVMENAGLCLDRFGLPHIPGSAVKGCARRAALAALHEWCETNTKPTGAGNLFTGACAPFRSPAEMLAALALVFGWSEQEWQDKKKEGRMVSDFAWACGERYEEVWMKAAEQLAIQLHVVIRLEHTKTPWGSLPNFAGRISFLPAYPVDLGKTGRVDGLPVEIPEFGKLELDVVTCHHGDYYDEPNRDKKPLEWDEWNKKWGTAPDTEDPVPVLFPAVAAGHVFAFAMLPLRYSPPEHLLQPHTWLAGGLATFGLGAKTAAGYGWFDTSKTVQDGVSSAFQRASLSPSPALLDEFLTWDDKQVRKAAAAFAFAALVPKTGRESTREYRFTLATFILESRTALFLAQKTHAGSDFAKGVKRLAEEFQLSLP